MLEVGISPSSYEHSYSKDLTQKVRPAEVLTPRCLSGDDAEPILKRKLILDLVFTFALHVSLGRKDNKQHAEHWLIEGRWHKFCRKAV